MDIKQTLKKNRLIYEINARIKAALTTKSSNFLAQHYEQEAIRAGVAYDRVKVLACMRERLSARNVIVNPTPKGKLNIFLVGTNMEQDYSGFVQGLKKFGNLFEFKNQHGDYGLEPNSKKLDPLVKEANSFQLLAQIDAIYRNGGRIDVLIGQMWASHISVEALRQVQGRGIVTVGISMDDRLPVLWEGKAPRGLVGLVSGLDLVLTTCSDCCIRYLLAGCPAIFWPMASDPDLFKPAKNKDIDVSFVGNNYGTRGVIIRKLMESGIRVEAYGNGWANGYIGPEKISEVFGRSKIILGVGTVAYNNDIFTLKLRDFDATMSGALYLTHRSRDLLGVFSEDKELACYSSTEEAICKIGYYLRNIASREKISATAFDVARKRHTWEIRLRETLNLVGVLEDSLPLNQE